MEKDIRDYQEEAIEIARELDRMADISTRLIEKYRALERRMKSDGFRDPCVFYIFENSDRYGIWADREKDACGIERSLEHSIFKNRVEGIYISALDSGRIKRISKTDMREKKDIFEFTGESK